MSEQETIEEIEIVEETQEDSQDQEVDLSELSSDDVDLINKHELVPKEEETEDGKKEKVEKKEDDSTDEEQDDKTIPSFEDVEKDEKLVDKYDKNAKAFYWKWKTDKHKRQEAQKELTELKERLESSKTNSVSQKKLEKIATLVNEGKDDLTIESLQAVINEKVEEEQVSGPIKPEDVAKKVNTKLMFAEKIGTAKYDNFIEIANIANEMFNENVTYKNIITDAINSDGIDENQLVETLVSIAKLSPKYKDIGVETPKEIDEKTNRVIKNSKKKISSASVGGSTSRRVVSYKDLTLQQLVNLPSEKYNKVPKNIRDKLLSDA